MTPKIEAIDDSTLIINEIETTLAKVLQKRRDDVERDLQEKIRREKEDSERKLSQIQLEFEQEKEILKDYRGAITEFETAGESLQLQIREHIERVMRYQQDIEKLTSLSLDELRKVDEMSSELITVRVSAEKRVSEIRTKLIEKYGIVTEAPKSKPDVSALGADLEQELSKLKKIKELLEKDPTPAMMSFEPGPEPLPIAEPPAVPEQPEDLPAAPAEEEMPRSDFKMPEINQFIEDFVKSESQNFPIPIFPEPAAVLKNEPKITVEELNFQTVFETLEKYRKSDATDYNGEISYFQNKDRVILDGESLIRAVAHILETARKLMQKLGQTESPKDQFFIKQDLINNQEILRKVVLRGVKMCEKEAVSLPQYAADVLNIGILKEILEKLNMDNWSNSVDFQAFEEYAGRLKDAFYKKITPPARYLYSIVEELEA